MAKKKAAKVIWFDAMAQRLRIAPDTLREWIAEGKFPGPRGEGRAQFYLEADWDAYLLLAGRWRPAEGGGKQPGSAGLGGVGPAKGGKRQDSAGSGGGHLAEQ